MLVRGAERVEDGDDDDEAEEVRGADGSGGRGGRRGCGCIVERGCVWSAQVVTAHAREGEDGGHCRSLWGTSSGCTRHRVHPRRLPSARPRRVRQRCPASPQPPPSVLSRLSCEGAPLWAPFSRVAAESRPTAAHVTSLSSRADSPKTHPWTVRRLPTQRCPATHRLKPNVTLRPLQDAVARTVSTGTSPSGDQGGMTECAHLHTFSVVSPVDSHPLTTSFRSSSSNRRCVGLL